MQLERFLCCVVNISGDMMSVHVGRSGPTDSWMMGDVMNEKRVVVVVLVLSCVIAGVLSVTWGSGPKEAPGAASEAKAGEHSDAHPSKEGSSGEPERDSPARDDARGSTGEERERGVEAGRGGEEKTPRADASGAAAAGEDERAERAASLAAAADKANKESGGGGARRAGVDKEDIREAVKRIQPELVGCYEDMLEDFPEAGGKIIAKLRVRNIEGIGEVEVVSFEEGDAHFDKWMLECLEKSARDITFPMQGKEDAEVVVRYPFNFAPSAPDEEKKGE